MPAARSCQGPSAGRILRFSRQAAEPQRTRDGDPRVDRGVRPRRNCHIPVAHGNSQLIASVSNFRLLPQLMISNRTCQFVHLLAGDCEAAPDRNCFGDPRQYCGPVAAGVITRSAFTSRPPVNGAAAVGRSSDFRNARAAARG